MLLGVCGGVARFFRIDATLVRVGFAVLTLFTGVPLVIYLVLAIIVPKEPIWGYEDETTGMFSPKPLPLHSDLDAQLEHLEKQALVAEVHRLREELLKCKGV
jgi:phage shock protein PspC (stress-responsive transcriptional regulator)